MNWMKRLELALGGILLAAIVFAVALGGTSLAQPLLSFVSLYSQAPAGITGLGAGFTFPTNNVLLNSQANRKIRVTYLRAWWETAGGTGGLSGEAGLSSFRLVQIDGTSVASRRDRSTDFALLSFVTSGATPNQTVFEWQLRDNPGTQLPFHYLETDPGNLLAVAFGGRNAANWHIEAQGYYLSP